MKKFGLIGKKLTHSFSPAYFNKKFFNLKIEASYSLFELDEIAVFPQFLIKNPDISGLNITIPYKQAVVQYLNELDEVAQQTNSVNTIQFIRKNKELKLKGFNTDVIGFEQTLLPFLGGQNDIEALILGTGGAAASVFFVLKKLQIPFLFVSRNPNSISEIHYSDLNKKIIQENKLIINTSPVGMFPKIDDSPSIPYEYLGKDHFLFDLIYNPLETEFLKSGKKKGAKTSNGIKMLEIQAEEAWNIWNHS